jgi:uncharacterized circularly permuted ATP-grasp superfamily protein/uncharacterized alpha-E superfamily protein
MTQPPSATSPVAPILPATPAVEAGFFGAYTAPPTYYDEMLTVTGEVRPHWKQFARAISALGSEEFARRWQQAQHLVVENGIAYGAYGDPHDAARPWNLDPLPLLIPASEWQKISAGLLQRAKLLNAILADLYGPQKLLKRGQIPAEFVYRHPGFRRPYHGQHPLDNCFLHLYAADLGRSPDGAWWVLGDRTDAPSGTGYALENRIVTSRMLPDEFQDCRVERLAPYFIALRETMRRLAPEHRDNPRIALLSQGPASANFFEDAYLARYLGYTLVEGEDLTARNDRVMLKTLAGLLPVDVVLRRPNSDDCDPLELSGSSTQGVAGMLQASRAGNVAIANALGSGLVESPVIMTFLPLLCKELLSEELKLPGVATWWCADRQSVAYVLENLDRLIIRPAFRRRGHELQQSRRLINLDRAELAEVIRANPTAFVAQEQVARSSMPVWHGRSGTRTNSVGATAASRPVLQPSHIALRAFAVASDEGYTVMTGGLARVSKSVDPLFVSLLAGEGSKDVWVLSDAPVSSVTLLEQTSKPLELRRSGAELPSRVADHVFWLGRNFERADAAARLLRTVGLRITSETYSTRPVELPILLRVLAEQGQIEPGYVVEGIRDQLPKISRALPSSVFDENQPLSLRSIISSMLRTASVVRDRISVDAWRIIHRIDEEFRPPAGRQTNLSDLLAMIDSLIIDLSSFSGLAMESMTRTHTWRFLDLGRRMERAMQTINLLKIAFSDPAQLQAPLLEAVLEIADSQMTYRSRYLSNMQLGAVLDLLLTDETNPRSVAFQLVNIAQHVDALPRDRTQPFYGKDQRIAMAALHSVRMLDVQALAEIHTLGASDQLQHVCQRLESRLPELSDAITHRYLIHAGPAHQLAEIRPE